MTYWRSQRLLGVDSSAQLWCVSLLEPQVLVRSLQLGLLERLALVFQVLSEPLWKGHPQSSSEL
jgi:hypothetical protein